MTPSLYGAEPAPESNPGPVGYKPNSSFASASNPKVGGDVTASHQVLHDVFVIRLGSCQRGNFPRRKWISPNDRHSLPFDDDRTVMTRWPRVLMIRSLARRGGLPAPQSDRWRQLAAGADRLPRARRRQSVETKRP